MLTVSQIEKSREHVLEPVGPMRQMREAHGVSLRVAQEATGVFNMYKYETGETVPLVSSALRLAHFYETTVEELFGHLIEKED